MISNRLITMITLPGVDKAENLLNAGNNIGDNLKTLVENITTFNNYVLHPSLFFRFIWDKIVSASFDVCVIVGLLGLFLFICGNKKGRNITVGSMIAYYLIKCLSKL